MVLLSGAGLGSIGYGLLLSSLSSVQRKRQRRQAWREAVMSCGLQIVPVEVYSWTPQLKARAEALEVRIEPCEGSDDSTRIVIEAPGPQYFNLVKILSDVHLPWTREIEVGHRSFDREFFIQGPTELVFALLDAETRHELSLLSVNKRLEISDGTLRVELADEFVPSVLPRLLDLRHRFTPSLNVWRRLAENAREDPQDEVRLRNLLVLVREQPGESVTLEALRAACSDPNPEIQFRAAKELGAEGRDTLLEIAERMVYDDVSAEAVLILDRDLPLERARSILEQALRLRRLQTARAGLEVIGRGGAAAVDMLAEVMEQEASELAAAAAQALGEIGNPAAELPLILALQRGRMDLRVAAANALGRVGSVAAVLPLKEVYERSWLDRELRRATRQAIAEIQSRLSGAAPGQLSLAGTEAGQLSLAKDEEGQLSLADNQDGQLSITPEEAEEGATC
ncbi:MAG TPA: HEAT repeat domain-containing protein [Thermoanaerobaculia bacterium]